MKQLSVLLVNQSPLFAQLLTRFFQVEEGAHVCVVSASDKEFLSQVRDCLPDLVLFDIDNAQRERLEAISAVRGLQPGCLIIGVTSADNPTLQREVLAAGADQLVRKCDLGLRFFIEIHWRIIRGKRRNLHAHGRQFSTGD